MIILATDDFERASLGSNWSTPVSLMAISGSSDIWGAGGSDDTVIWQGVNASSFKTNQWAEVLYSATGPGASGLGCGIGVALNSTGFADRYSLVGNTNGWELAKFVAGVYTLIQHDAGRSIVAGDTLYLENNWGVLTVKVNTLNGVGGTILYTTTDTTFTGGKPGVSYSSTDGDTLIESWVAGSLDTKDLTPNLRPRPFAPGNAR